MAAQEGGAPPARRHPRRRAQAAVPDQPPPAAEKDPLREQTIYIPYERLKNVFEKQGRGVFLPYEKFQELWNAARAQTRQEQPPQRPVDAVITEIDSEATIADQVVNVRAKLQIEILGKGWVLVPLRLGNSAIRSAKIGDVPARIVLNPETGHQLLWQKEGDQPQQIELLLEYTRAFAKTPGQSSVEFDAPQAPINRWRIRVPEAGMSVQVEPMIAATRAPQDPAARRGGRQRPAGLRGCGADGQDLLESESGRGRRPGGLCHGADRAADGGLGRRRPLVDQARLRNLARQTDAARAGNPGRPESGQRVRPERATLGLRNGRGQADHPRRLV